MSLISNLLSNHFWFFLNHPFFLQFINGRVYTREGKLLKPAVVIYPDEEEAKKAKAKEKSEAENQQTANGLPAQ